MATAIRREIMATVQARKEQPMLHLHRAISAAESRFGGRVRVIRMPRSLEESLISEAMWRRRSRKSPIPEVDRAKERLVTILGCPVISDAPELELLF